MTLRPKAHSTALALVALAFIAACNADDISTSRGAGAEARRSVYTPLRLPQATIDDRFDALTRSVPGFGGLFYDANGRLTIYVKDPSTLAPASRSAVASFLAQERGGHRAEQAAIDVANAAVLPATYDFHELLAFYRSVVLPAVPTITGITSGDIDETKNRIVIGVGSADLIAAVQARVAKLGAPAGMVEIKEVPPTTVNSLLTDRLRPVPGGAHIYRLTATDSIYCTLGFNFVRYPGTIGDTVATDRYFVTASHCSSSRNSLDYSDSYQHGDIVANEWGDPAAFTNSYTSTCPVGKLCRFADASVYRYNDPSLDDQNHVALAGIGSLSFTGVATITSVDSPPVGYTVNMIGAKSGRRYATVEATCEDVFNIAGWTNGALLCQGRAAYFSQDGDSGAPVIELFGDGTAWAVGIHWGNYTSAGVLHSRFSPMNNVLNELYTRLPGSPYFSPVQY
jgi:hypothetical protein